MEDNEKLLEKITATIQRDVNRIFIAVSGDAITPEDQEALVKYYKLLTDQKLAAKERDLEEKLKYVEETLNQRTAGATAVPVPPAGKVT